MRTVTTHVLDVAVDAGRVLPICGHFLELPVVVLSEGTSFADALATSVFRKGDAPLAGPFSVPGFCGLKRVWSLRGLKVLDLTANLAPFLHDLLWVHILTAAQLLVLSH